MAGETHVTSFRDTTVAFENATALRSPVPETSSKRQTWRKPGWKFEPIALTLIPPVDGSCDGSTLPTLG